MRSKSDAIDYKYFPEPNIPYIELSKELIENVKLKNYHFKEKTLS